MADIRYNKQYCIVKDGDNTIIDAYFDSARVETPHTIWRYDVIKDIPLKDLPSLPELGEVVEKNKLYKDDNKAVHCIAEHTRVIYTAQNKATFFKPEEIIKPEEEPIIIKK